MDIYDTIDETFAVCYKQGPGFYQQNNGNSSYPDRRLRLEESLTKFMAESAKRYEENSNIIKEIRASTDAAIRNRGASIKTLEIQIGQMSKVLQERGFGSRPNYTEINPRDQVKSISTAKANFSGIRRNCTMQWEKYARKFCYFRDYESCPKKKKYYKEKIIRMNYDSEDGGIKLRFLSRKSFDTLADHLQEVMVESLPTMVDTHIKEQVKKQVPEQVRDQVPVYVAEGLILERQKTKEEMERMIAKAILQERGNIQAEISSQIQNAIDNHIPSQVDASVRSYMSGHILHVHPVQSQTPSVPEQQYQLYLSMKNDPQPSAIRPRDQDDPHDDAHLEGKNSAKRQKTSEYKTYVFGESSSRQVNEKERDDDEIPIKQVSQDIMEEVSLTIVEAKLKKMADEMFRQRCTSGDEHQYHIDQMKNFLKSDIVWESRKEILVSSHP
ncbi:hypothetical protein Tco_0591199 [Tanacetum coccineum]